MDILDDMRRQKAVYWPPGGFDDFGKVSYGDPQEIRVRWEDINEAFTTPGGQTLQSRAKVYAGQDLELQGYLWLGRKSQLTDAAHPKNNENAYEIKRFDKLPTVDGDEFLRTAYL